MMDNEALTNKKKRSERSLPAKGDNSDALLKDYMNSYDKDEQIIIAARGRQKLTLTNAKNDGFSKIAFRKAYKVLKMTEEQRQAQNSVDEAKQDYITRLSGLALFDQAYAA